MGSSGTFCGYTHVFQAREDKYDKKMVATPSRVANKAKSKMATILSENCKNSH